MSAASTIAAPAATAPRSATFRTIPDPRTEPGFQAAACMKDVVKDVSPSSKAPSGDSSSARVLRPYDGGMTPGLRNRADAHNTHLRALRLVSRELRVLNEIAFLTRVVRLRSEGSIHESRDRILRSVRLRTACPCGARADLEAATLCRHKPSKVRRRRLRNPR
jgi:hypothetical protein